MVRHGGAGTAYANYGCRCEECTEANRRRIGRRRAERMAQVRESGLPASVEHGLSAYTNWGCRCEICSEANRRYCASRRIAPPEGGQS